MKLYVFAAPYDYHKQAQLVVMAETVEEAQKIARKLKKLELEDQYSYNYCFFDELKISDVEPEDNPWYMNYGCDC